MSRRVLIVGKTGQVAQGLARAVMPPLWQPTFLGRDALDLAHPHDIGRVVHDAGPALIINAAAYTAVDRAEAEPAVALAVNRDGPEALAHAAARAGAPILHVSTDYVFDGTKATPYVERDPVNPLSVYGRSKEAGERAVRGILNDHVILRTSWVYSPWGANFVKTMLRLGAERDRLTVVADQYGAPTAAADIAAALIAAGEALLSGQPGASGTYHFTGAGETSWHGFAQAIFAGARARGAKTPAEVAPIPATDYPLPAARPANSRLDCRLISRVLDIAPTPWTVALDRCLDQLVGPKSA